MKRYMKPKTHLLVWLALGLAPRLSAQVVINEFLADNEGGLRTQAGDAADWIELANPGSEAVDLSGWYLTDRASDLTKWRIPDGTSIPAQGYLVVFADSSTNAVVGGELHASFSLSREGEYLGLVRPDGTSIAHEYAPSFPPQLRDISYGLSTPPEQELLGANTPVRYRVPTAEGAGPWREGVGSLGFSGALIETDVAEGLWGVNTRLDAEWSFTLESAPAASDQFTLWVRCADGFVATLNGAPLASLNAPVTLEWDSQATAARPVVEAVRWQAYPVPAGLVTAGVNTLAVTALNDAVGDPEFLMAPRLTRRAGAVSQAFFKTPTPGAANAEGFSAPTPVVTASEPRGYKGAPFSVTLTCPDPAAEIRYTVDGSVPGPASPLYAAPLSVSRTTTLRASVVDPAAIRQNVTTVTWLFLEDILQQGTTPPPGWPANRQVNNHVMEYGVRQAIVTSDGARLRQGMTNAIASLSLVTDLGHLFNAQRGIYVNPGNDGIAWERPVSVELIDPVQGSAGEFQIDAGLRIRGAYSRSSGNPKHAFRLFFRSTYGEGRLRFPLFGDEGAAAFDKVDLRTSQNYSWAFENSPNETFVRETFSRDSQRDMGMPYTRSRYYHLYLNGQYWGLYQTQERGDADFAESYLGGNREDWDCIKTSQPGYTTTASDGTFDAFYALHNLALTQGFTGAYRDNYWRARGLNSNGTRNPSYPVYLDEDNLIVYMLVAYYTGDPDSPVSIWGGFPNNMYGLFNRVTPDGFKWLRHDAEHSLGAHGGYPVTADTTGAGANFTARNQFNPATLHQRLCQHPEYRRRFADLVQKHLYGDGALTPANAQQRFRSRMDEIDLAIIGESARWGRGKTRDATWLPACNAVLNTYLAQRRDIVIGQFRQRGWFPSLDAPLYSVMNTEVTPGQAVRLAGTSTFYYTTDGSDPRLPDGGIHPAAVAVTATNGPTGPRTLVARGARWHYFDAGREPEADGPRTWRDPEFMDAVWPQGSAILGFAGSATANPVATRTRRYVTGASGPQVTTTYFRHTFTLDSTEEVDQLLVDVLRDDGVVVYLNGVEILRDNMNPGVPTYDTYSAGVVGSPDQNTYFTRTVEAGPLLRAGPNVLAVEVHQCNESSSDLYFDLALTVPGNPANVTADVIVREDLTLKARAFDGTEWSALSESRFTVPRPSMDYGALRIAELMYAPPTPDANSSYTADDFAWLELVNLAATPLDLAGVRFGSGINHTFAPLMLSPGARLVLVKNLEAFTTRYATNDLTVVVWTGGNLARSGETLSLVDPDGNNLLTFTYSRQWYPETFATGTSLVAIDLTAAEPLWSTTVNWRPSRMAGGTPGLPEPADLQLLNPRLTAEGWFVVETVGLEGPAELWFSEDCRTWTPCDPAAWSVAEGVLSVNLGHPSLAANTRAFFQVRLGP